MAIVQAALPSAATVQQGACVHLVAENVFLDAQDEASLRVKATTLDVFPCGDSPPPPVNAGLDGERFPLNADFSSSIDIDENPLPPLEGQLVSYRPWLWLLRDGISYAEMVAAAEVSPGSGVRVVRSEDNSDDLALIGQQAVVVTGVYVTDFPDVTNPAARGVGPALVVTSVTDAP